MSAWGLAVSLIIHWNSVGLQSGGMTMTCKVIPIEPQNIKILIINQRLSYLVLNASGVDGMTGGAGLNPEYSNFILIDTQ